ncbi:MAG: phage portal protein [Chloroflexi bacterium]|nr:phage portal protein [Chloroflexota bacterium]
MNTLPLPQQLERMDAERLRRYQEHLAFYSGRQWVGRARPGERRLTFNYAKAIVDKLASYVMSGVSVAVEPWDASTEAAERARRAQEALRQVYQENALETLDLDTELDASILGDGAFKVTWDADAARVRVTSPDVQGLFAWWQPDDPSRLWRVASRYRLSSEEASALYAIESPVPGQPQGQVTVVEAWTGDAFQLWAGNHMIRESPNLYGFIPFVLFPNLRVPKAFWGESDLPALVEPARELNRALSQLSAIVELSGNPIAVLEGVERAEDIAVQPGAVWELPERARAYLLDLLQGGGVKLHIDFIDLVYRAIHDISEAPRTSFGDNPKALSGVALEMEMNPLMQRVRRKRLVRSAAYQRRNEMVLRLLEQHTRVSYLPVRQEMVWGPVLPQDRGRLVRDEALLVGAGLHSKRTAMEALGVRDVEGEVGRIRGEG